MTNAVERAAEGPIVLLVDDYDDARQLFAMVLESAGFRVIQAETGRQGLERAALHLPHIIVTDLALPDIEGCELTRLLKADARTAGIPVLALSASGSHRKMREAVIAGCTTFVSKTKSPRYLIQEIRRILAESDECPAQGTD